LLFYTCSLYNFMEYMQFSVLNSFTYLFILLIAFLFFFQFFHSFMAVNNLLSASVPKNVLTHPTSNTCIWNAVQYWRTVRQTLHFDLHFWINSVTKPVFNFSTQQLNISKVMFCFSLFCLFYLYAVFVWCMFLCCILCVINNNNKGPKISKLGHVTVSHARFEH